MTFAEKANLASKYMAVFHSHTFAIFWLMLIIIILGAIGFILVVSEASRLTILITGIVLMIILAVMGNVDQGQGNQPTGFYDSRANIDFYLHKDYRQLPKYKHKATVKYRQSLHLKGAKAYCVSHQYCHDHHKVEAMKHYLKVHNPQAPWINIKF